MFGIAVKCSRCEENFPYNEVLTVCIECGGALLLQYVKETKYTHSLSEKKKRE